MIPSKVSYSVILQLLEIKYDKKGNWEHFYFFSFFEQNKTNNLISIVSWFCFFNLDKKLVIQGHVLLGKNTFVLMMKVYPELWVFFFSFCFHVYVKLFLMNWKSGLNQEDEIH